MEMMSASWFNGLRRSASIGASNVTDFGLGCQVARLHPLLVAWLFQFTPEALDLRVALSCKDCTARVRRIPLQVSHELLSIGLKDIRMHRLLTLVVERRDVVGAGDEERFAVIDGEE